MPTNLPSDLLAISPALLLVVAGIVILLTEAFLWAGERGHEGWLSAFFAAAGLALSLALLGGAGGAPRMVFGGAAAADGFGYFISAAVCLGLLLASLTGIGNLRELRAERGEFYALAHFSAAGMVLLAQATDLLVAFVALEVMSVATYALAAYLRRGARPAEAAFKYFILGAFSSAVFLYGVALLYGATGHTALAEIAKGAAAGGLLLKAGAALLAVGFAFKVAAVPFHMWAPDVYEGSATPVTSFMAVAVKAAAFAALARAFTVALGEDAMGPTGWLQPIAWLAILTMLGGNLLALPQRSVKRMLAYSSIAHAGYLLVGVAAAAKASTRGEALESLLVYIVAYTLAAAGAFAVVAALERKDGPEVDDLQRYAGLSTRHPLLAAAMAVFMIALGGIPPTAGFIGKLYVFKAAVNAELYTLAVVGVLTSLAGAYYYLRVVVWMYMRDAEAGEPSAARSPAFALALSVSALAVLALGVLPGPLAQLAARAGLLR
jgi:NADH-quinone oxidoreductase subunit N